MSAQDVRMTEKVAEKSLNVLMKEGNHVTSPETAGAVMTNNTSFHPHHPADNVIATKEVMSKKGGHWMSGDIMKEREKGLN